MFSLDLKSNVILCNFLKILISNTVFLQKGEIIGEEIVLKLFTIFMVVERCCSRKHCFLFTWSYRSSIYWVTYIGTISTVR